MKQRWASVICDLCQHPTDAYLVADGRAWCTDTVGCYYRARRRLGIPAHVNQQAAVRELEEAQRDRA